MTEKPTQRDRVADMLREHGTVTTAQFLDARIPRFSARLKELRDRGWIIEDSRISASSYACRRSIRSGACAPISVLAAAATGPLRPPDTRTHGCVRGHRSMSCLSAERATEAPKTVAPLGILRSAGACGYGRFVRATGATLNNSGPGSVVRGRYHREPNGGPSMTNATITPRPGEVWVDRFLPNEVQVAILGVQANRVFLHYTPSGRTAWLHRDTFHQMYEFDHDPADA